MEFIITVRSQKIGKNTGKEQEQDDDGTYGSYWLLPNQPYEEISQLRAWPWLTSYC